MGAYVGSGKATLVHGDFHPAELYKGGNKRAGWKPHSESNVTAATIEHTYNDTADVVVKGNTTQLSDWYAKDGLSSQAGTPTPDAPIPITSNLPAGTYKYTSTDGIYEFTLAEELRGIGTDVDKIAFDRVSHAGSIERNIEKITLFGTESWVQEVATSSYTEYYSSLNSKAFGDTNIKCSHFVTGITSVSPVPSMSGRKTNKSVSFVIQNTLLTTANVAGFKAWLSSQNSAGNPVILLFQLATPTRTPLTFTKVSSSSAPECPMTFLTNTPSLDYPADVVDASGNILSNGAVVGTLPPLRKVGEVSDEFVPKTGLHTQNIGVIESYNGETITTPYISTTGGLDTGASVYYQLATPVITQPEPVTIPTHYPATIIETYCVNAIPTMDINCKVIDMEV